MNRDWTVDTYVLYQAAYLNFDAIDFLISISKERNGGRDTIALDQDRRIDNEYINCIEETKSKYNWGSTFVSKWFIKIVNTLVITRYSGNLCNRHKEVLKKLKFHNDDWPFVAVCACTKDKNLVSEESDYNDKVKEYLQEKMEVHVLSIQDSLNVYK